MNWKVAAAFAVVVAAIVAWLTLWTTGDRGRPARMEVAASAPIDARGVELAREISRLRRQQAPETAPQRGRDVFRFAAAARATRASTVALPVSVDPPVVRSPGPALRLIGVAEDTSAGTTVRTAIIAAPDQLYVVREGERVMARYGVARISSDVVELVDTTDASALRLALK